MLVLSVVVVRIHLHAKADLRTAQFKAYADKFAIAQCIVKAKIPRSLQVLEEYAKTVQ